MKPLAALERLAGLARNRSELAPLEFIYSSTRPLPYSLSLPDVEISYAGGQFLRSVIAHGASPEEAAERMFAELTVGLHSGEYIIADAYGTRGLRRRVRWDGEQWHAEPDGRET